MLYGSTTLKTAVVRPPEARWRYGYLMLKALVKEANCGSIPDDDCALTVPVAVALERKAHPDYMCP
jgi:hypothetical protein